MVNRTRCSFRLGAFQSVQYAAALIALIMALPTVASSQTTLTVLGLDASRLYADNNTTNETRFGISVAATFYSGANRSQVSVAFLPQDGVNVGWFAAALETGGSLVHYKHVELLGLAGFGAHHMNAEERERIAQQCQIQLGCFFEGPGYTSSWAATLNGGALLNLDLTSQVTVSASARYSFLVVGSNRGKRFSTFSFGIGHRWR